MYRFIKLSCALAVAALAFAQCTKDLDEISVGESANSASATKIINSSRTAIAGTLLIKFDEEGALAFENGTRSGNGVTRSNIEPLNNVLIDINAVSIERVFPVDVRNEKATREAGLHRWYIVRFDKEQSLDKVAYALAEVGEIQKIEFEHQIAFIDTPTTHAEEQPTSTSEATRLATPQFNDPGATKQWDFHNVGTSFNPYGVKGMDINVYEAWKYVTGDSSVIVAVIDQGVDYRHDDLKANMWVNEDEIPDNGIDDDKNGYIDDVHGYNFVVDGPISWDKDVQPIMGTDRWVYGDNGHGTHIAGTIAAVNNNGIGVCGIAGGDGTPNSGVKIMSAQIFSGRNSNNATQSVIAKAFKYAVDNGAVIANNSWGSSANTSQNDSWYKTSNSIEYEAINNYFIDKAKHPNLDGGVAIFAAGNDGYQQSVYPGAFNEFISVTSIGIDGVRASYSNYGPGCNIAAPGGNSSRGGENAKIYSTMSPIYRDTKGTLINKYYVHEQGTSMACPHVTGVAALGLAYAKKIGKKMTAKEFMAKLLVSVNDIDSYQEEAYKGKIGTGCVDAFKFLMNIEGIACIPVTRGVRDFEIDLNKYLADGETNITFSGMEISEADMKRLGMTSKPKYLSPTNSFAVTCNNTGSAIVTVKMIAGGDTAGTGDNIGGMIISKKFALVVRDGFADNGGWM